MQEFTAEILPMRVRFGWDMNDAIAQEIERLGLRRMLMLSTPQQSQDAAQLAGQIGPSVVGQFNGATMHTPQDVTETALQAAQQMNADGLISFGGGSTTGLGKAIALRTGLPQIAVPTTYAGSEATPILGQTENGIKTTQRAPDLLPEVVVYDVNRTLSLPVDMTMTSGLNALAHAIAALYARDGNPISTMMATAGITALIPALQQLCVTPTDRDARAQALFGAWMCGTVLGQVSMSLHHKLCHVLGGSFDLAHAPTHSVILPHATAYNATAAGDKLAIVAQTLGGGPIGHALHELARKIGAPTALRDLGMPETGIDQAAKIALENPYWNPRPLERAALIDLIRAAWAGHAPA